MDENRQQETAAPQVAPPEICTPGFARTCTIQCASTGLPGSTSDVYAAGALPGVRAEACTVVECTCQPVVYHGASVADPTLPIALLIFGMRLARP